MTEHTLALAFLGGALLLLAAGATGSRRRKRRRSRKPELPPPLLPPVLHLLARVPFDLRSPSEQRRIVEYLKRIDAQAASPGVHAKIQLLLAEMALVTGDRDQAQLHFRAALGWDPRLPVRRTLERLEARALFPKSGPRAA
jgi:hypothetical protein